MQRQIGWFDTATKRFVSPLVPGAGLQDQMVRAPLDPALATNQIGAISALGNLQPVLSAMQLMSTVGAVASVANLGVCIVGFALVLRRLTIIDGKMDEALGRLEAIKRSVDQLQIKVECLTLARLRSAGEALDRALAADSDRKRLELCSHARDLFLEARSYSLELWKAASVWHEPTIPVRTAMEMQNRYVACALGEAQAEFISGDMGAFRHVLATARRDYCAVMVGEPLNALQARSDAAVRAGQERLAHFSAQMPLVVAEIRIAASMNKFTVSKLEAMQLDAELPELLMLPPHEIARALREATGTTVYALCA